MKRTTMLLVLGVFAFACEKDLNEDVTSSTENTNAQINGGGACDQPANVILFANQNPSCASGGNNSYDVNTPNNNVENGVFTGEIPEGFTFELSDNGRSFNWSYDGDGQYCLAGISVIVKGGNNAFMYEYDGNVTCGSGLNAPLNNGGRIPAVSHVNICYSVVECGICYNDESAWTAGSSYNAQGGGNWATYTAYDGSENTVNIFSGQTNLAGTATFSAVEDGEVIITINLADNHLLKDVDQPVKIQAYSSAPSGNVSPGSFTTYKGASTSVTLPEAAFYGVHLDVLREVPCE